MIALPKELAPWSAMLSLFAPDLAGDLGRMLPRIALAVGPMRAARPTRSGEPDGFSGVARRGSYERLLLSEWLLADEAPDEFARRASMGEHAFFELARRSPARAASSVALFATGPAAIGAPRLAELAALVVLAARAEAARARFAWGVMEQRHPLHLDVTPASVKRLLDARTAFDGSADDVAAWIERAKRAGWEDVWLVGAGATPRGWPYASLEIHDVVDPDRRALSLVARAPGAPPREIELELPGERACVRLVKDPFYVPAPPPPAPRARKAETAAVSNLIFAENGTKLFARGRTGDIVAYPVPNSPRDPAGTPKRYRARTMGSVCAVGWVRRGLVMITVGTRFITLEHTASKGPTILRAKVEIPMALRVEAPSEADPLSPLVFRERPGGVEEIFFMDARRALFRLRAEKAWEPKPKIEKVASEVTAFAAMPTHLAYVARDVESEYAKQPHKLLMGVKTIPHEPPELDHNFTLVELRNDGKSSTREALLGDGSFAACFGTIDRLLAVQQRGEAWSIPPRGGIGPAIELKPPAGVRVVGVTQKSSVSEPELIVLEPDRRTLSLVGRGTSRSLPSASAPIAEVATSHGRYTLAYATEEGEVVIHSFVHEGSNEPLARFAPT